MSSADERTQEPPADLRTETHLMDKVLFIPVRFKPEEELNHFQLMCLSTTSPPAAQPQERIDQCNLYCNDA